MNVRICFRRKMGRCSLKARRKTHLTRERNHFEIVVGGDLFVRAGCVEDVDKLGRVGRIPSQWFKTRWDVLCKECGVVRGSMEGV